MPGTPDEPHDDPTPGGEISRYGADLTIPRHVKVILAILVSTAFVMLLNETTLAVALPSIMTDYGVSETTAQWLLTGFMLTMAVVLPATGWLLGRFSTRAMFVSATGSFLVGSVIAAVAPTFALLLLARVLQGLGTAIIMPLLMTVAMTLVPAPRRGTVMGLISVVMAAGPALGPTVAGVVLSFTSWHGIFWLMVPLMVMPLALGTRKLTDVGERSITPFDLLSVLLSVVTFGGLIYGLSSLGVIWGGGEEALYPTVALGLGAVGLVVFVWRQLLLGRADRALLDLRPLVVRNFTLSLVVLMCMFGALLGVTSTLPLYLQDSLLATALVAGLVLLPGGLLEAVLSPVSGRFFDRFGPRPLIAPGIVLMLGALLWLLTADETTGVWTVVAIFAIFSIGVAMLLTPLITTALGSLPKALYGHGSAILNTLQQLSGAFATASMITIYGTVGANARALGDPPTVALATGTRAAVLAAVVVSGLGLLVSLFITRAPRADRTT